MSNASVASDRPIVRYPEVAEHMMTCPTCKAAGPFKLLTFDGGSPWPKTGDRRCRIGRALDRRLIDDFGTVTVAVREEVKRLVREAIVTLGVDGPNITQSVSEALDEILKETADPDYAEEIRRLEARVGGRPSYAVDDDDKRDDAMMALESLARQGREDDFRRFAQRKGLEHVDVLWSAMRFRYLEEC
jgi:hypothetical protein